MSTTSQSPWCCPPAGDGGMAPGRSAAGFFFTNSSVHRCPSPQDPSPISAPEPRASQSNPMAPVPEPTGFCSFPGPRKGLMRMGRGASGNTGLPLQTLLLRPRESWRNWVGLLQLNRFGTHSEGMTQCVWIL